MNCFNSRCLLVSGLLAATAMPASAAYIWLGNSDGLNAGTNPGPAGGDGASTYAENNWDDDSVPGVQAPANNSINNSSQSPAGVNAAIIINNGGVSGAQNGAGSPTAHFRTNGNAVTVTGTGSGLKLGIGARLENDGTAGGGRSQLEISGGGFVATTQLHDINATLSGINSQLVFHGDGDNGLGGFNSIIHLTGGFGVDSPVIRWGSITAGQLFVNGVLDSLTVNGAAGVWGTDPLVYEPGDNLLATAETFNSSGRRELPQAGFYTTTRNGFNIIAVPEPSAAALLIAGMTLTLRRRRFPALAKKH